MEEMMRLNQVAWEALEAFMQRNEYLIDREYMNACRHFASQYDRDDAFDVWQSTVSRYAVYMLEIAKMTGMKEDRPGPTAVMTDAYVRSSLIHLAGRIPMYAMLRTGRTEAVEAMLRYFTPQEGECDRHRERLRAMC